MEAGSTIWDVLPSLRRFAFALTGSLGSGDALVKLTVAALAEVRPLPPTSAALRLLAYRQLLECSDAIEGAASGDEQPGDKVDWPSRIISALDVNQRRAFLLHTMEAFPAHQCAEIMGISESEFRSLFSAANLSISSQTSTDVLIIEDEVLIARDLQRIVERLGHRVIGRARTRSDVPRVLNGCVPGLVLADIKLADESNGIDAVNDILVDQSVPVIFITSYPQQLLTGPRPVAASLLAKPFAVEGVSACISQALLFQRKAEFASDPSKLDAPPLVSGAARLKRVVLN